MHPVNMTLWELSMSLWYSWCVCKIISGKKHMTAWAAVEYRLHLKLLFPELCWPTSSNPNMRHIVIMNHYGASEDHRGCYSLCLTAKVNELLKKKGSSTSKWIVIEYSLWGKFRKLAFVQYCNLLCNNRWWL